MPDRRCHGCGAPTQFLTSVPDPDDGMRRHLFGPCHIIDVAKQVLVRHLPRNPETTAALEALTYAQALYAFGGVAEVDLHPDEAERVQREIRSLFTPVAKLAADDVARGE